MLLLVLAGVGLLSVASLVAFTIFVIAGRHDASVQRVMLAWLREQSPNIVPLVGASRPASIRDSANPLRLTAADLAELGLPGQSR